MAGLDDTKWAELNRLIDRAAIEDVVHAYAWASDTTDADAYIAVFAEGARILLPNGMVMAEGVEQISGTAATLRERFGARGGSLSVMRHVVTNLMIDLDGDEAQALYYVMTLGFDEVASKPDFVSLGRYNDRLIRSDGRWLIAERTMHYDWGNDGLARALEIGPHTPERYKKKPA